jgi:protein-disulfide isomerase
LPLIERTTEEALRLRLTAVPTLFIGDRRVEGQLTESQLTALIQIELDKLAQNEAATAEPAAAR